jgi:hypothetical protein
MKLLEDVSNRDTTSVDTSTSVPITYDIDEENQATRCSTERVASSRTAEVEVELMVNKVV